MNTNSDEQASWRIEHWNNGRSAVTVDADGQWEAGLVIDGERAPRLLLRESWIGVLFGGRIDEYDDRVYGHAQCRDLRDCLTRRRSATPSVFVWQLEYIDHLMALIEEALGLSDNDAVMYFSGP